MEKFKALGAVTPLPANPSEAVLETIPWVTKVGRSFQARFSVPEFTSLCPVTGQPDFAHIVIDYVPSSLLVESKSLKLFLGSFRNAPSFHEETTYEIGDRIFDATTPAWLRVAAFWYPRGGIPIDCFYEQGALPAGTVWPPVEVPIYRGR